MTGSLGEAGGGAHSAISFATWLIAVEMAGILNALGSETHLLIRHKRVLRNFDELISANVTDKMVEDGVHMHQQTQVGEACIHIAW